LEALVIDSVKGSLSKYAVFSGRATRNEFWTFYLFYIVINVTAGFTGSSLIENLVTLGLITPLIACGARRMHDVGKSGWFQLVPFYNLYLLVQPSALAQQGEY
jgi:uncharacterized membrane protein YhaH (DUF805 family)